MVVLVPFLAVQYSSQPDYRVFSMPCEQYKYMNVGMQEQQLGWLSKRLFGTNFLASVP